MEIEHTGWVIVRANDSVVEWSFRFYRKDAINAVVEGSQLTWKEWYKEGFRCLKATKTISTL